MGKSFGCAILRYLFCSSRVGFFLISKECSTISLNIGSACGNFLRRFLRHSATICWHVNPVNILISHNWSNKNEAPVCEADPAMSASASKNIFLGSIGYKNFAYLFRSFATPWINSSKEILFFWRRVSISATNLGRTDCLGLRKKPSPRSIMVKGSPSPMRYRFRNSIGIVTDPFFRI